MNVRVPGVLFVCLLMAACSKDSVTNEAAIDASATAAAFSLEHEGALRTKGTIGGVSGEYAAIFAGDQLERIVEHRQTANSVLGGEYTYRGARLLRYRGAKLDAAVPIDLEFDMKGVLTSGKQANVTEEDIRAIRGRAELLRNHALAQRATRTH